MAWTGSWNSNAICTQQTDSVDPLALFRSDGERRGHEAAGQSADE